MNIRKIDPTITLSTETITDIINFLHDNLDQFADPPAQIQQCLKYAQDSDRGGIIYLVEHNQHVVAASVILNTQMEGFIPPYVLVYIAVYKPSRGQGIAKNLLKFIQKDLNRDICLHCDHDNPAKLLYEKVGFENRYLEMRWQS